MQIVRYFSGIVLLILFFTYSSVSQQFTQVLKGVVTDLESHQPLSGVNVLCKTCQPKLGCSTDSTGQFNLQIPIGRHSLELTHVGYNLKLVNDIQVGTGKEVFLTLELEERIYQTEEVAVRGTSNRWINPMASVSVRSLRSQDASRYAGGYFDPLRMVTNFAGVASGNSDDNNEIVIRGNSPRGLLWRLEGMEIPNPNHFSGGQGASGGGYSSITTNMLSTFDFFTGSFPAEFGNAYSGVMDLNLRNGNTQKNEFTLALSVLGAEGSAEGPIGKTNRNSFMGDFRIADFSFLKKSGIITVEELDVVPKTTDWVFKTSFKTEKSGTFDLFSIGSGSRAGDTASGEVEEIKTGGDRDEYIERHSQAVAGIKHTIVLPNNKTYIRTTAGFTYEFSSDQDDVIDTLMKKTITYYDTYEYPSVRFATLINHKFNANHSLRFGATFNQTWGDMFAKRLNKAKYDTLINSNAQGWYSGYYIQWKYKEKNILETNTGIHFFLSGINKEFLVEPRFGIKLNLAENQSLNLGLGVHSRLEPLSVYNFRVKISGSKREESNIDLKTIKAFHFTAGYNLIFPPDFHITLEGYFQSLYHIPVSIYTNSQFSIINTSYGLPDVIMANNGKSKNKGMELTFEKTFSKNYYFLFTASLFNSKYRAPDDKWYNTYFNTNYVYNLLAGKEFPFGLHQQHVLGFKIRNMFRGGFRYTPADIAQSQKSKKLVYQIAETYGERLPGFKRIDAGMSYRLNLAKYSWNFLIDIQNVLNTRNILRRRFEYNNKAIVTYDSKSMGIIPVFTIKTEF